MPHSATGTLKSRRNVGATDRTIRIAIGLFCIYMLLFPTELLSNEILRVFVAIFGFGNLLVGLFVFCPLYSLADVSTHKPK